MVLAIGVVAVAAVVIAQTQPEDLPGVETFPDMGRGHLAEGESPPAYNSSPPTSGKHAASSAPCGVYRTEVPDEIQVHNLEHGTIIVQYQPGLAATEIQALEAYARTKPSHILVAPRDDLSDPVVVTSWTRMLRLDTTEVSTIDSFYDRYARRGPEVGVACPFTVDESV